MPANEAFQMLVSLVVTEGRDCLDDGRLVRIVTDRSRHHVARETAGLVAELLDASYAESMEFQHWCAGRSESVIAMKARLVSDPVHRAEFRARLEAALGKLPWGTELDSLVSERRLPKLQRLRILAGELAATGGDRSGS